MNTSTWKLIGLIAAGLLALALVLAFVLQAANPSVQGEAMLFTAHLPLAGVEREGSSIRLAFLRSRTSGLIHSTDPELLAALQAAAKSGDTVGLSMHLSGAYFARGSGYPVYWVRNVRYADQTYGPFKARPRWSWRVLREEQVALLRGIALNMGGKYVLGQRELDRSLESQALPDGQRGIAHASRARLFGVLADRGRSGLAADYYLSRAVQDYAAAEALLADDSRLPLARAGVLHRLGAYDDALSAYDSVLRRWPGEYLAVGIPKASLLRELGRFEESLRALDAIAGHEGENPGVTYHYYRGWTLLLLNRHAEAVAAFTAGLETQPDYTWAHVGRACVWLAQGDLGQASGDLRSAVSELDRRKGAPSEEHRALRAELAHNAASVEAQREGRITAANVTACQRFQPDFLGAPRKRSRLLDKT